MYSLQGKVVLITGASSGIGEACARSFAAVGANLILGARRIERLEQLATELKDKFQVKVLPLPMDVTQYQQLETALAGLADEWKQVEVLINNAGLSLGLDKIQEGNVSDWEVMIDTNIKGLLYMTRLILPGMIERGRGHIINLGSTAGNLIYPGGNVYCATKAAVHMISEAIRVDVCGTGVRETLIAPGMVKTDFSMVRFSGDHQRAESVYEGVEYLTAEDIADIIVFCATRPLHVDLREVVIMPTQQASAYVLSRKTNK